ncbi:hypothetical protein C8F01DRAFT_1157275 [Mycena amicta]|nr:hypothetical protein C8F01DRAFT_1157275 [Mycena amicta]
MHPAAVLLPIALLLSAAAGDDTIELISAELDLFEAFGRVDYRFNGASGHQLNNITLQLRSGNADATDSGDASFVDLICVNCPNEGIAVEADEQNAFVLTYPVRTATPSGEYHFRLSGTVFSGSTVVTAKILATSQTFGVTRVGTGDPCGNVTFSPINTTTSTAAGTYSPWRMAVPVGGAVYSAKDLAASGGAIRYQMVLVDGLFNSTGMQPTLDLVNVATNASVGSQGISFDKALVPNFLTSNLSLTPGTWQLRATMIGAQSGNAIAVSDQFYIKDDANPAACLASAHVINASDIVSYSSTPPFLNIGNATGGVPDAAPRSVEFRMLNAMWAILCMSFVGMAFL